MMNWTDERTRLWNEWLATPDGREYEAGWGDRDNRDRAERGRAWVEARLAGAKAGGREDEPCR